MFDWHNVFSSGHSKLAPNNSGAQGNALLGILMRSWAGNMKPDVAMKLINTKYRTPSPHQFFASGRFDVIAADVSFRDIKRRGEWNEGGGRERGCARARVCRDPVRVDHHSFREAFTRCIGRFKSSFSWNWVETFHSKFRSSPYQNDELRQNALYRRKETCFTDDN